MPQTVYHRTIHRRLFLSQVNAYHRVRWRLPFHRTAARPRFLASRLSRASGIQNPSLHQRRGIASRKQCNRDSKTKLITLPVFPLNKGNQGSLDPPTSLKGRLTRQTEKALSSPLPPDSYTKILSILPLNRGTEGASSPRQLGQCPLPPPKQGD